MSWTCRLIEHQNRRMLFMAGGSVSEFEANCNRLVSSLRQWQERHGEEWMPFWRLSRKHPWSEREHEEVRTALLNQRLIEYQEVITGGRPARLYRLANQTSV